MPDWRARRLDRLPPYLFSEIDRLKRAAVAAGRDVIDFGIGDPDLPTPGFIVARMERAVRDPAHHRYPADLGLPAFRTAAAGFLMQRFGVSVDPQRQILALIGSKEGLGHLPLAVVDAGDAVLVPEPNYPVYQSAAVLAGAQIHPMPLAADRNWLPDLEAIPADVRRSARLMYLNYPNNPTGSVAPLDFLEQAVQFARDHDILIAQDAAYSELYYGAPPPSILQVSGSDDVAVEFHSLSKTFNMTGWRIGFVAGNESAVRALAAVKSNVDSGQFHAIQEAATEALSRRQDPEVRATLDTYRRRRDSLVEGLQQIGLSVKPPAATFFVWAECPGACPSMEYATRLLSEAGVVVVPGAGFGLSGEGYVRLALTVEQDRIVEALDRIRRISL